MNEYVTDIKQIEPQIRKFDPGKWPVCKKCGQSFTEWLGENKEEKLHSCGGKVTTLRKYVTEVLKEEFIAEKWKLIDEPDLKY